MGNNSKTESFLDNRSMIDGLRRLPKYLNMNTISSGLIAGIFGATTTLIIVGAGTDAGLTQAQIISWVFACWFFGPVVGLLLSLKYKQPIPGAWSIPGAALVASALKTYSLGDLQGAYFVAGLIVLILGVTGLINKVMKLIPMPIVMAMIAGAMMRFCTGMIKNLTVTPIIVAPTILTYFVAYRFRKKFPPILAAVIVGTCVGIFTGAFEYVPSDAVFMLPQLSLPSFNGGAIISVAIPLALLVVGAENAQAMGVLTSQGYKAPIKAMTIYSGIGGLVTSFFGGPNANIAGPMTAICASEESGDNLEGRYAAVVVNFVVCGSVGFFASVIVPFITVLPKALIFTIAGLAMIGVILGALQNAFKVENFQTGAFFAFIIALSGISVMGIGSPFWALIGGVVVAFLIEKSDFDLFLKEDTYKKTA